jgi:hypothetical protein
MCYLGHLVPISPRLCRPACRQPHPSLCISRHRSTTLLGTELVNYSTHGISQPDGVVFAAGGTIVNALMIFCVLPLIRLLKRRSDQSSR